MKKPSDPLQEAASFKASYELLMLKIDSSNELIGVIERVFNGNNPAPLIRKWQQTIIESYLTDLLKSGM